MSELAQRLVEEARSWKGTKFQHLGQIKHVGVDCAHFVALVARDAGIKDVNIPHNYRPREDGTVMLHLLREHMEMIKREDIQPGDVLALCGEDLKHLEIPRHLVFVSEVTLKTIFIVHVTEGRHGVTEHRTNLHWLERIHSCWRLKE